MLHITHLKRTEDPFVLKCLCFVFQYLVLIFVLFQFLDYFFVFLYSACCFILCFCFCIVLWNTKTKDLFLSTLNFPPNYTDILKKFLKYPADSRARETNGTEAEWNHLRLQQENTQRDASWIKFTCWVNFGHTGAENKSKLAAWRQRDFHKSLCSLLAGRWLMQCFLSLKCPKT